MPFEPKKTNFTILNHELYNLIRSALQNKIGVYVHQQERKDVKNRGGELNKFSFLKSASNFKQTRPEL